MINFFIKHFVKDYRNTADRKVRERYCVFGGILGAVCNVFLFAVKLFIGLGMNSIAIMSDAFNNLSDMGSCVVAIIGAKMSNQTPDRDHPFGHGRIEYISTLIVSFIIIIVGYELFRSSIDKIIHPDELNFSVAMIIILTASLLIKFWMFYAYTFIGKAINSSVMRATARDSINDVISTSVVIGATVIGHFLPFRIDGCIGVAVAVYIVIGGIKLAKETIDLLLGTPPEKETVDRLSKIVLSRSEICGIHDLIIHDYGPGRVFASVHAEVPDDADMVRVHEVIDSVEREVMSEMGINVVIHTDPVSINNEHVESLKKLVLDTALSVNSSCSIHDFRITDGTNNINLIFDIIIPDEQSLEKRQQLVAKIIALLKEKDPRLNVVATIDEVYA